MNEGLTISGEITLYLPAPAEAFESSKLHEWLKRVNGLPRFRDPGASFSATVVSGMSRALRSRGRCVLHGCASLQSVLQVYRGDCEVSVRVQGVRLGRLQHDSLKSARNDFLLFVLQKHHALQGLLVDRNYQFQARGINVVTSVAQRDMQRGQCKAVRVT